MSWWQAIVLGIVEGLTEYLPVSSTGHLIIANWAMGLDTPDQKAAVDAFDIVIQAGAIAAVLGLYWPRVWQMLRGVAGKDAAGLRLAINLLIAVTPALVLGPVLHKPIKTHLFSVWPVVAALFVGAWLMLTVGYNRGVRRLQHAGREVEDVTWQAALIIGLAQAVAMWPGTSRSMMAIVAALLLGFRARAAAEFSFLLGLVTLTAATGFEAAKNGQEMVQVLGAGQLALGFIAATVSAALAVKWFVAFLTRHGLAPFGWYRLGVAALLAGLLFSGLLAARG